VNRVVRRAVPTREKTIHRGVDQRSEQIVGTQDANTPLGRVEAMEEHLANVPLSFAIESQHLRQTGEIASILFVLPGAMTIVELVDATDGFALVTSKIHTTSTIGDRRLSGRRDDVYGNPLTLRQGEMQTLAAIPASSCMGKAVHSHNQRGTENFFTNLSLR